MLDCRRLLERVRMAVPAISFIAARIPETSEWLDARPLPLFHSGLNCSAFAPAVRVSDKTICIWVVDDNPGNVSGFREALHRAMCIVWVGFDDYRELNREGARSALPVWTEFMKRAARIAPYGNAQEFAMPDDIEQAAVRIESGKVAGSQFLKTRTEYFIAGSEPEQCDLHPIAAGPTIPQAIQRQYRRSRVQRSLSRRKKPPGER
jgi:hypothetical protein